MVLAARALSAVMMLEMYFSLVRLVALTLNEASFAKKILPMLYDASRSTMV